MEASITPTTYTACVLSEDVQDWRMFTVRAEYVGKERWAVRRGSECLGRSGEWVWEMRPSSRTDEWLDEHRFTQDEALRHALEQAALIEVNGRTAEQWFAEWSKRRRRR
jgi:hypothetical protein